MIKTISSIGTTALLAAIAVGCAAPSIDEASQEPAEAVAQTSQALRDVNNCAMNSVPNAVAELETLYSMDTYSRANGYIDGICPDIGKDRPVTIVDFAVSGVGREYTLWVHPTWWEATTPTQCMNLELNVRLQQRRIPTQDTWDQLDFQSIHGVWVWDFSEPNFGHCNEPKWSDIVVNQSSCCDVDTYRYRVRTEAIQYDGTHHATVSIGGRNSSS